MKSLYDTLEISPAASDDVLKAAYRALCHRYHPDKNIGADTATEAMTAVNRAYAILSDPAQRAAYDALLARHSPRAGAAPRWSKPAVVASAADDGDAKTTPSFSIETRRRYRAAYLGAIAIVLFAVGMIYAVGPSVTGAPNDLTFAAFKEPPDPYMLRMNKGEALLSGNGSSKNFLQAKAEFEAIAGAKDFFDPKGYRARAAQRLAEIYFTGSGVPKNTVKAEEWFRQAAEHGRVVGPGPALSVAQFFEAGTNGAADPVEAYRWYNLAAGTPFDLDKTAITRDAYNQTVKIARQKRDELGAKLSMDEINRAQRSPLPPCKTLNC